MKLLTTQQIADYLRISKASVWRHERNGVYPKHIKKDIKGTRLYSKDELEQYLAKLNK